MLWDWSHTVRNYPIISEFIDFKIDEISSPRNQNFASLLYVFSTLINSCDALYAATDMIEDAINNNRCKA